MMRHGFAEFPANFPCHSTIISSMHSKNLENHISKQFDLELEGIHKKTLALGGLVEMQFKNAVLTLITGNSALNQRAIHLSKQIDDEQIAINEACAVILARRQPTASDLRLLITVIKTVTELVRISKAAEHIDSKMINGCSVENKTHSHHELEPLYHLAQHILHQTLETFAELRIELADASDGDVSRAYDNVFRLTTTYMLENPKNIRHLVNVLYAAREIARVAETALHMHKNLAMLLNEERLEA